MKLIAPFLLSPLAVAAQIISIPTPPVIYQDPIVNMPPGKIYVKTSTIPKAHVGQTGNRIQQSCGPLTSTARDAQGNLVECGQGAPKRRVDPNATGGAFRLICGISHWSFDDPIVWPNKTGMTHLHQFFGNTKTDFQSDPGAMHTFGLSTCHGGLGNRTGYWTPVIIYHCPAGEVGCDRMRDGEVLAGHSNNAYYKVEWVRPISVANTVWWDAGFRMISGDPNNTDPARMPGRFDCMGANTTVLGVYSFSRIPSGRTVMTTAENPNSPTKPCGDIDMLINFPRCSMPGVQYLPSAVGANHSGHVQYPAAGNYCDDPAYSNQHPIITYNIHTLVKNFADWDYLRLSSDLPATAGVMQSGSTTTSVRLSNIEPSQDWYYTYGFVSVNGERREIQSYNGTTKVATLYGPALATAPAAGSIYRVTTAGGRSMHGDWANGWDQNPNFNGWGRKLEQQIIRGCYFDVARYGNPAVNNFNFDCHDDLIGDPGSSTTEPRIGGTYFRLF